MELPPEDFSSKRAEISWPQRLAITVVITGALFLMGCQRQEFKSDLSEAESTALSEARYCAKIIAQNHWVRPGDILTGLRKTLDLDLLVVSDKGSPEVFYIVVDTYESSGKNRVLVYPKAPKVSFLVDGTQYETLAIDDGREKVRGWGLTGRVYVERR